jgi:Domain of unknown function (DUF397)
MEERPMPTAPGSPEWRKSTYSSNGSDCVEVAVRFDESDAVGVRDSKNPGDATLAFSRTAFDAFLAGVRRDAYGEK